MALAFPPTQSARADKVIQRIHVRNPLKEKRMVQVRANLPAGVRTNNILNLDGLDLGYDVNNDTYYVHKTVEVAAGDLSKAFNVEIEDVWTIPVERLDALRKRAGTLVDRLKGREFFKEADGLRQEVDLGLSQIQESQKTNAIALGVPPIQHIRAYEVNMEMLGRVQRDIVKIENLVLGTRQDPGQLIDIPVPDGPRPRTADLKPEEYKPAIVRITAQNTSTSAPLVVSIRRDLPAEVGVQDVLNAGGLDVARDQKTGVTYVYKKDVRIAPAQTVPFDVKIRDKWNVNAPRFRALKSSATNLHDSIRKTGKYRSLEDSLQSMLGELQSLEARKGPEEVNDRYVEFYRQQTRQLDEIDLKLARVKSLLQPITGGKFGVNTKPPSPKTTWGIIYGVLGFLALLTVMVSVRWLIKGKADRMVEAGGGPAQSRQ